MVEAQILFSMLSMDASIWSRIHTRITKFYLPFHLHGMCMWIWMYVSVFVAAHREILFLVIFPVDLFSIRRVGWFCSSSTNGISSFGEQLSVAFPFRFIPAFDHPYSVSLIFPLVLFYSQQFFVFFSLLYSVNFFMLHTIAAFLLLYRSPPSDENCLIKKNTFIDKLEWFFCMNIAICLIENSFNWSCSDVCFIAIAYEYLYVVPVNYIG